MRQKCDVEILLAGAELLSDAVFKRTISAIGSHSERYEQSPVIEMIRQTFHDTSGYLLSIAAPAVKDPFWLERWNIGAGWA